MIIKEIRIKVNLRKGVKKEGFDFMLNIIVNVCAGKSDLLNIVYNWFNLVILHD
jgi:hypothetical protein